MSAADSALSSAEQRADHSAIARANENREKLAIELSVARLRVAELTLRAPVNGTLVMGEYAPHPGDFINEGQDFVRIVDRTRMRARILVHDWELNDVAPGSPVRLMVAAYPFRSYEGRVERILPAAASDIPVSQGNKVERHGQELTNYFAVEMIFPNPDGTVTEGMTGMAKIAGRRRPYAWQAAQSVWRWLRLQIW